MLDIDKLQQSGYARPDLAWEKNCEAQKAKQNAGPASSSRERSSSPLRMGDNLETGCGPVEKDE